jgi:hypothetical protein
MKSATRVRRQGSRQQTLRPRHRRRPAPPDPARRLDLLRSHARQHVLASSPARFTKWSTRPRIRCWSASVPPRCATPCRISSTAAWTLRSTTSTKTSGARSASAFRKAADFFAPFCTTVSTRTKRTRRVFDGVWADIAGAGRGGFNARFAQPSRDGNPFFNILYPVDIPPFADEDGLLANAKRTNTVPKIFYTNGSYEYWGRAASLIHTTPDGKRRAAAKTRASTFSPARGMERALFLRATSKRRTSTTRMTIRRGCGRCWSPCRPGWDGKQPPASVYPLIAPPIRENPIGSVGAYAFPKIPGVAIPHSNRRAFRNSTSPPSLPSSGRPSPPWCRK